MPEDKNTALNVVRDTIKSLCYKHTHVKDPTAAEKRKPYAGMLSALIRRG